MGKAEGINSQIEPSQKLIIAKAHKYMATLPSGAIWLGDGDIQVAMPQEIVGPTQLPGPTLPIGCVEVLVQKEVDQEGKLKETYRKRGYAKDTVDVIEVSDPGVIDVEVVK